MIRRVLEKMAADQHEEQVLGKAYDGQLMRRLLRYIWPYRGAAALAFLYIILGSALSVLPPWLTKLAIDRYIQNFRPRRLEWNCRPVHPGAGRRPSFSATARTGC